MRAYYAGFQVEKLTQPLKFCGFRDDQSESGPLKFANIVNKSSSSKCDVFLHTLQNHSHFQEGICRQLNLEKIQTLTKVIVHILDR